MDIFIFILGVVLIIVGSSLIISFLVMFDFSEKDKKFEFAYLLIGISLLVGGIAILTS